jgi:hypothetical protein
MVKKRTSLEALINNNINETQDSREVETISQNSDPIKIDNQSTISTKPASTIVKQTVYLPAKVHDQLRSLAFEERKKMHDYLVEGLERVFKDRGLKSFAELSKQ